MRCLLSHTSKGRDAAGSLSGGPVLFSKEVLTMATLPPLTVEMKVKVKGMWKLWLAALVGRLAGRDVHVEFSLKERMR